MNRLRADWTFNQNRGGGYCGGTIKGIISDLAEQAGIGESRALEA